MSQFMAFRIGEEEYGIDIAKLREIVEFVSLTFVPKAPNWVEGILNHHGRVVTVINPASFFDLSPYGEDALKMVAVINDPAADIGFLVKIPLEMVSEWETKAERSDEPELIKNKYVEKVIVSKGRVINILDMERFIGDLDGYFA